MRDQGAGGKAVTEESGFDQEVYTVTRDELKSAVREAVHEAFDAIGMPIAERADRDKAREYFRTLRRWHETWDATASTVGRTVIVVTVGGFATVIAWLLKVFVVKQ